MNRASTVAALGLSGACFAIIGLVAAQRLQINLRVCYADGRYFVAVRHFGEWRELREFVQPFSPSVVGAQASVWDCLDWVCRNISYQKEDGEFWWFPSETLAKTEGDCEDSTILLVSMLRSFTNAYVVLGDYQGWGHAWGASEEGEILEATYNEARAVPDPEAYHPYVLFNDQEVIEMWPGALREVFQLRRDEVRKLNLIASALLDNHNKIA
jgi:hypothetical protein